GIGRRHDRDLGHAGYLHEQLLDLRGTDVGAPADDDVLLAIGDGEIAVRIDDADVTARVPAVVIEGLAGERRVGVARAQVGAPAPDLARRAGRDAAAPLVDQPQLHPGARHARGA